MPPRGGRVCPPGASRPALWASSAGGLQPPDPRGLRAPLWPLNASTGPLRPVWQVAGVRSLLRRLRASKGLWRPVLDVVLFLKFKNLWSKQGAVGKSRTGAAGRPRPQAVDGGLVHGSLAQAVERIQRGTGGGPPLGGGDRGQSPLVGISGEAPKRIFYLSACSKPCFRFA